MTQRDVNVPINLSERLANDRKMIANVITSMRLLLTFGVIFLFGLRGELDIVLMTTIAFIFTLDAVDGAVARKRGEASAFGARFDIVADRIIENAFWIYFACQSLIPFWLPILVVSRGFLTDILPGTVDAPKSRVEVVLTCSRVSRTLYGLAKMITFLYLAGVNAALPLKLEIGMMLVIITVVMCLLRGLPLLIAKLPL